MGILLHLFTGRNRHTRCQPATHPRNVITRRHLQDSIYALPKDVTEERRIDFQHYLFHQLFKGHYVTPIDSPIDSILDVGTGTGRWAIDMAKLFPQAQVVGLDKEVPTTPSIQPRNYHFVEGSVLQRLPFADGTFSFVHQRLLVGAIPAMHWPGVLTELVRVTQPGGFLELVEGGSQYLQAGPATSQIVQWGTIASRQVGIDASMMTHLDTLLSDAGISPVEMQVVQVPVGQWGGHIGKLLAKDMHAALAGLQDFYGQTLGISPEQFQCVVAALPDEWEKNHTEYEFYVAYGQKIPAH